MLGVLDNYLKWIVSMTSMTNSRITLELGPPPPRGKPSQILKLIQKPQNIKMDTKNTKTKLLFRPIVPSKSNFQISNISQKKPQNKSLLDHKSEVKLLKTHTHTHTHTHTKLKGKKKKKIPLHHQSLASTPTFSQQPVTSSTQPEMVSPSNLCRM